MSSRDIVVLPLLKFSFATTSINTRPIPWEHCSSGNLTVVVHGPLVAHAKSHESEDTRLLIIKGREILEDINVNDLAEAAREARVAAKSAADLDPGHSEAKIAVVVGTPCIAIKYPTSDYNLRRFQIRFSRKHDFNHAVEILRRAGVPLETPSLLQADPGPDKVGSQSNNRNDGPMAHVSHQMTHFSQHRADLISSVSPQTLFASQDLKLPAFQSKRASHASLHTGCSSPHTTLANKELAASHGVQKMATSTMAPSTAPVPLTRSSAERPDPKQIPPSTLPNRMAGSSASKASIEKISSRVQDVAATGLYDLANEANTESLDFSRSKTGNRSRFSDNAVRVKDFASTSAKADNVDTQELLAKVTRRTSRSKGPTPQSQGSSQASQNSSSRRPKARPSCQSCKLAHKRCVKDAADSQASCRPCKTAGLQCSLTVESQKKGPLKDIPCTPEEPIANPPRDTLAARDHATEVSLTEPSRSRLQRIPPSQSESRSGWKRRSQDTMAPPPCKRLKDWLNPVGHERSASLPVVENIEITSYQSANLPSTELHKPFPLRTSTKQTNGSYLQSDATTATCDTDDLNPRFSVRPQCSTSRDQLSDRPAFSELSEAVDTVPMNAEKPTSSSSGTQMGVAVNDNTSPPQSANPCQSNTNQSGVEATMLKDLIDLDGSSQRRCLQDLVIQCLRDDDFVELCKKLHGMPYFSVLMDKV